MKTKHWILIFIATAGLCVLSIVLHGLLTPTYEIVITQDGQELHRIDLNSVRAPYELTIEGFGGENTLRITGETIWITHADCPGQDCVLQGPLLTDGPPIVCLPHRLVIRWAERRIDG